MKNKGQLGEGIVAIFILITLIGLGYLLLSTGVVQQTALFTTEGTITNAGTNDDREYCWEWEGPEFNGGQPDFGIRVPAEANSCYGSFDLLLSARGSFGNIPPQRQSGPRETEGVIRRTSTGDAIQCNIPFLDGLAQDFGNAKIGVGFTNSGKFVYDKCFGPEEPVILPPPVIEPPPEEPPPVEEPPVEEEPEIPTGMVSFEDFEGLIVPGALALLVILALTAFFVMRGKNGKKKKK